MIKIIVSACLMGHKCRYDGTSCDINLDKLKDRYEIIAACPEILAGLPTPREPIELLEGRAVDKLGNDYTSLFNSGAEEFLRLANDNNCRLALLKSRSPSCGYKIIYDGTFSSYLINGNGITADKLIKEGIIIVTEDNIEELYKDLWV